MQCALILVMMRTSSPRQIVTHHLVTRQDFPWTILLENVERRIELLPPATPRTSSARPRLANTRATMEEYNQASAVPNADLAFWEGDVEVARTVAEVVSSSLAVSPPGRPARLRGTMRAGWLASPGVRRIASRLLRVAICGTDPSRRDRGAILEPDILDEPSRGCPREPEHPAAGSGLLCPHAGCVSSHGRHRPARHVMVAGTVERP